MNIEEFRDYCLAMPGVSEGTPFEKFSRGRFTVLVFYVAKHMFCYFKIDDFTEITVKCDPTEIVELKEQYEAVGDPFNGDKRYWIGIKLGQDMSDDDIKAVVRKSYDLVKAGGHKKKR